jgi:anti-sigma regulatory factor (Ser/Thr protein kinase)
VGYRREYSAHTAAAALQAHVRAQTRILRDGRETSAPTESVVPGDVVLLSAGSIVPADGIILEATDFFVSEAMLTGESSPVEKRRGVTPSSSSLRDRVNCIFLGTNVRSGTARCLIAATGRSTEFGAVAHRLTLRPPITEFDRGLRRFGYLLTSTMVDMLRAALLNLTMNACQAAGALPVEIAVSVQDGGCRIAVSDHGPGIPADVRERVFEPFFTTRAGGTGLGLAIVKRLIELLNGTVTLTDRPGGGTVAELSVPLAPSVTRT